MKFLVVTHVEHINNNSQYSAHSPYVKEINIWIKRADCVRIISPISDRPASKIDTPIIHETIDFVPVPIFSFTTLRNTLKSVLRIPGILSLLVKNMYWADHIHIRCPGNMGLLGCIIQIFFPKKIKTVKFAGNWDPKSLQPLSYYFQKRILSSKILSYNLKVLVYGKWSNQSSNVIPFFTASYSKNEIFLSRTRPLNQPLRIIFVGRLIDGKRPLLVCKALQNLVNSKYDCVLDVYGEGPLSNKIANFVMKNNLESSIQLHGNVSPSSLKKAYSSAHFLILLSKSEGWPKAVAEAMFWGCVPIVTAVSCLPYMLGHGQRGSLIEPNTKSIIDAISYYLNNPGSYQTQSNSALKWARKFTLERWETEINSVVNGGLKTTTVQDFLV